MNSETTENECPDCGVAVGQPHQSEFTNEGKKMSKVMAELQKQADRINEARRPIEGLALVTVGLLARTRLKTDVDSIREKAREVSDILGNEYFYTAIDDLLMAHREMKIMDTDEESEATT